MQKKRYRNHNIETEVEAVPITAANVEELARWCHGMAVEERDAIDSNITYAGLNVPTRHGIKRGSEGVHYLVLGDHGFEVMPAGIFETSYVEL